MSLGGKTGKVIYLRTQQVGEKYGPPGPPQDFIDTEVVVKLDSADMAFGFQLRPGDQNLPARLAMLSGLRDAYVHQLSIRLEYDMEVGKKNGYLRRVIFQSPPTN